MFDTDGPACTKLRNNRDNQRDIHKWDRQEQELAQGGHPKPVADHHSRDNQNPEERLCDNNYQLPLLLLPVPTWFYW